MLTLKISTIGGRTAALRRAHSNIASTERTALYDLHVQQQGKIVNFSGYQLPVQYAQESISTSHEHVRRWGGIFDVSHMLQSYVRGRAAISCFESLCTADLAKALKGTATLTCFTNGHGGILDDLIVSKIEEDLLYVVSNAATKAQDIQLIGEAVRAYQRDGHDVSVEHLAAAQQSLIAVQGPKAVATLASLLNANDAAKLEKLYFMNTLTSEVAGVPLCRITRCGYTGEDGVEISVPSQNVQHVTEALLHVQLGGDQRSDALRLAGLGARDTLRLEAGLCLYGADLNAETTPVEAGLNWLIAKRRRQQMDFPGAQTIMAQLRKESALKRQRIGLVMLPPTNSAARTNALPAARSGVQILNAETSAVVGTVTSGCLSPTLGQNIAMAYWDVAAAATPSIGTQLRFNIRGKLYPAVVAKMPFVKAQYYNQPKK